MLTRSGKTLLPLFAVTMFAPTLVLGVIDGFGGLVLANLDPRLTLRLFCGAAARMTGRLLLVGVVYLALSAVKQLLELIPAAMPTSPVQYGGQFAVVMLGAAAQALGLMVIFAGILITYAERRGDEGSLTPDLVNQL